MWVTPGADTGGVKRGTWNVEGDPPLAGCHYPASFTQFASWFTDEPHAAAYIEAVRFRHGLACVRCGLIGVRRGGDGTFWCGLCRRRFSATTGTLLERTHVPLGTWLAAAWQLTNTKSGVSAVSLSRSLDLRYETSWYLLHKLRAAMSFVGHDRLHGDVELDETFVGGFAEGTGSGGAHARSSNKTTVIVAAERATETTIGRIRMARSLDSSVLCLARFISDSVESGAILHTDGWPSDEPALELLALEGLRYELRPVSMVSAAGHAHDCLFGVHRAASLLKRWLLGTHQGSVSAHQIDHYLAEFVFRFNRRASRSRGLLFLRLVCALVETKPVGRDEIAARKAELVASDYQLALEIDRYVAGRSRRYRAKQAAKFTKGIPLG
jgi:transposase-like protein